MFSKSNVRCFDVLLDSDIYSEVFKHTNIQRVKLNKLPSALSPKQRSLKDAHVACGNWRFVRTLSKTSHEPFPDEKQAKEYLQRHISPTCTVSAGI